MKRTLRSVVTLLIVLSLLVGVFSSTVALAAGSLADGTGTPEGSYDGGWLEIEYDDDELCVVINPDVRSLLDINREELNKIIETVIDAVSVMVIEDIKDAYIDDQYGDGDNDTTGIDVDTIWHKALDNYLEKNGYNDVNDDNAGYINFFDDIINGTATVDGLVEYICDLIKTAVKTDVIDKESLPTAEAAWNKLEDVIKIELDKRIANKAVQYADIYVDWFFSGESTAPEGLTDDVFGFINGKVVDYVMGFVEAYPDGDSNNAVYGAIHGYIDDEIETSIYEHIDAVIAGVETDEDIELLYLAGNDRDEIYQIIITDIAHKDRIDAEIAEALASITDLNAVEKAREAIDRLDPNDKLIAKSNVEDEVDSAISDVNFKNEAINAVWGIDETAFFDKVDECIDSIVAGYSATLVELDGINTEITFSDLIGYLEGVTVNGILVFGDFGADTYTISLEAIAELISTLPRPEQIKDMSDEKMAITWDVELVTTYGDSFFTVTVKAGGGYDKIRTLARVLANNVSLNFSVEDSKISLDLELNCPEKFAKLLLKACDTDKLPDGLKNKIFSFVTMTGEDMYAFYEELTFGDLISMLESVDFEGLLDAEFLKDYVDLSDLSNEEIINKVKEYEGYFNTAMKYLGRLFDKVPERFMDNCLLDLYKGNGSFAASGERTFSLERVEALLTKISAKYGPLLASLIGDGNVTLDLDVKAHFEKINKVEYYVDGSFVGAGLLPVGASVKAFAPATELAGNPIAYWIDEDGNKVDLMPDDDIKLYAVVADSFEIVSSANVSKVYDGEAVTVSVTVLNGPEGATYTYSWTKDGVATNITTASFEVVNVSDSGVYVCTVSDGVNSWVADAITVEITKKALTNVEWNYTAPFTYDKTDKTVALVLPEGVTVVYTGNSAKNAGTYYADVVSLEDTTGNYDLTAVNVPTLEWVINKAVYDMSGVSFENKTVVYDGAYHGIELTGTLPEGVTVTYSAKQYKAGTYPMTATFTIADPDNYEAIAPMSATLTITPNNYKNHTYVDKSGNTVIIIDSVNGIPVDYELTVSDNSHIYVGFTLEDGSYVTVHAAYDITFVRQGTVQPVSDTFTVKLLVPTALRGRDTLKIAYVNADGKAEILESTIDGDYIVFTTTHFSTYAIVEDAEPPVYPIPADYTWIWILVACVLGAGVIALVIILIIKKRKGKKDADGEPTEPTTPPTEPTIAPVEEAPIEEAPVEEAPVEEAPIEEAPVEEAPVEEAPVEEAPVEEAPVEEAPVEEAPVEEAPVEEAPVEEAPVEEAPVEEAPVEEAPVEEAPVEEAPKEEKPHGSKEAESGEDKVTRTVIGNEAVLVHYRSSFQSRLIQAEESLQDYYSIIKNTLLGYKGIKSRTSWNMESFNKGRVQCAKMNIKGKTLLVYLALDPNEYNVNKYHFTDASDKPKLDKVPMMMKVKSDRSLKYTVELIREMMTKLEIVEIENAPTVDYHMPYETTEELARRGLVKVILPAGMVLDENANIVKLDVGELINTAKDNAPAPEVVEELTPEVVEPTPDVVEEPAPEVVEEPAPEVVEPTPEVVEEPAPEVVEEPVPEVEEEPTPDVVEEPAPAVVEEPVYTDAVHADELLTDEEAEASIEVVKTGGLRRTGKLVTVNLDTLCENFEAGATVDLDAMKAKRLVPKNAGRVKVLARGTMTEALTIIADKYSLQAVKMIALAGGHAEIEG